MKKSFSSLLCLSLKTENWHSIIERFARKLGAAQMLAQNAAWTSYDEEAGFIMLSLTDEAKATANKERLDKNLPDVERGLPSW